MAEKTADPFAMWREFVAQSERQWNAFLNEAMATEQFSQAMGRMMDFYVNLQKGMNEVMGRYLQFANLPSRQEVLALGERLGAIEDRLVRMERLLAGLPGGEAGEGPAEAPAKAKRPARTKRPPSKDS
ncbi:poly(R)-hydroxyalkanoic acid synthase subunit PhaE [Tepidiforma sp.]|uniref:poly(R)-hydroxyalkanoic acid synthase subunit PhaE n=1 Tax=Tepidiforma sp. TaxID=2682230 RepID=UPI002ADE7BEE|nr:poly(R)-hydroxyalkanoic acid synthase subunit PhaE [Tepidiforma sp.]